MADFRAVENRVAQIGFAHVGAAEVGFGEIGTFQVRAPEFGVDQIGAVRASESQIDLVEARALNFGEALFAPVAISAAARRAKLLSDRRTVDSRWIEARSRPSDECRRWNVRERCRGRRAGRD